MSAKVFTIVSMVVLLLASCMLAGRIMTNDDLTESMGFTLISQEEAVHKMNVDDGHIIVDVRGRKEYAQGHIPGAICIPVETIGNAPPEELPDFTQIILVYCRSGRRSRMAAEKLASMGYARVYDFGGIMTWKGDIVKEDNL